MASKFARWFGRIFLAGLMLLVVANSGRAIDKAIQLVRAVDSPGVAQPFVCAGSGGFAAGEHADAVSPCIVPLGKRLVLQQVSVIGFLTPSPDQKVGIKISTRVGTFKGQIEMVHEFEAAGGIPITPDGPPGTMRYVLNSVLHSYSDPETSVDVVLKRADAAADGDAATFSISGYLVDVP